MSSDRHSRNTKHGAQNRGPEQQAHELQQEQEEDQELEVQEAEHSREQRQVGNQAVQARMSGAGSSAPSGQGGGGGRAARQEGQTKQGAEFGGDPDDEAPPVTLEDIVQSWNPSTKTGKDLPSFREFTSPTDLPEPDNDWLVKIKQSATSRAQADPTLVSMLQPPLSATTSRIGPWIKTLVQFLGDDALGSSLRVVLTARPMCLADPHGRPLHGRVHLASVGGWSALGSAFGATSPSAPEAAFLEFLLHLSSQGSALYEAETLISDAENKQLPRTTAILEALLPPNPHNAAPRDIKGPAMTYLVASLRRLSNLPKPYGAVPSLAHPEGPVDDVDEDPLGLDEILQAFTGPQADPDEGAYQRTIENTERLAAHCITTRIALGGLLVAAGRACAPWSAGPPFQNLMRVAMHVEERTDNTLKLLVEIAQTATRKSVPLKGLGNGLRRAAKQLKQLQEEVLHGLSQIIAGVLPHEPDSLPTPAAGTHPIQGAWEDGALGRALTWIQQHDDEPDKDTIVALLEQVINPPSTASAQQLHLLGMKAIQANRFGLASVLLTMAANAHLWSRNYKAAIKIAAPLRKTAQRARHGMGVASSTLIIMEAFWGMGQPTLASVAHREGGVIAYQMGAYAALDRLARWQPPPTDEFLE